MPDRIAIKRLTRSDLSFFQSHYEQYPKLKQKGINLNANVFIDQLYPSARMSDSVHSSNIPAEITILGPGAYGPYRVNRPITAARGPDTKEQKNWRLNGQFVPDPPGEADCFAALVPGDIALMEFAGEPQPSAVTIILVSGSKDADLHKGLARELPGGRHSMVAVSRTALASIADAARLPLDHPLRLVLKDPELEAALEDAAFGSAAAVAKLRGRTGPRVTAAALAEARGNAELVGADGEELAWVYLCALKKSGLIEDAVWTSKDDAAAPWDFEVTLPSGENVRIDAKSTNGPFARTIHTSAAELLVAAEGGVRYDIWRLFEINKEGGLIRVAENIASFARNVLAGLALPAGVRAEGFSIEPGCLKDWSSSVSIKRPDEGE